MFTFLNSINFHLFLCIFLAAIELSDFDFGPKPIKGVSFQAVPSMFSTVASAASAGFSAYSQNYGGTSTNKD